MVSKGFPNVTTSGRQYNIEEKPSVIYCTLTLISMQVNVVYHGNERHGNGNCVFRGNVTTAITAVIPR